MEGNSVPCTGAKVSFVAYLDRERCVQCGEWISRQNSLSSWQPDDMMRRLKFLEYVTGLAPCQMEALHDFFQDWSPAVL